VILQRLSNPRTAPWILACLTLLLLLPGTATLPLIDRDEPRFVRATVEMIEKGEWIVPSFGGKPRFDKPILSYWMMRAGLALCGQGEFGARLYSVASALALVLLTWNTGRRWFGQETGFISAFALATSLQIFIHGRLALADMPMVFCVAAAMVALAELLRLNPSAHVPGPSHDRFWWWVLHGSVGLGFLAKGPVVFAVPAVAVALFRLALWRSPLPWANLRLLPGLLFSLALMAAWGVPALLATDGRFFAVGVGEHVVQRGFERFNHRGYNPFFYLGTAPLSFFPWIGFAGLVVSAARRRWSSSQAWLASWLAAPYLIFTFYATQLPHYILPAFPAFFLLLGQGVALSESSRWRKVGMLVARIFGVVMVVAAWLLAWQTPPPEAISLQLALVFGLMALAGFTLFPSVVTCQRAWLGVVGLVAILVGGIGMAHHSRAVHPAAIRSASWRALDPQVRLVGGNYSEPSSLFYADRPWEFPNDDTELAALLAKPGPVQVLQLRRETEPVSFLLGRPRWREVLEPPSLSGLPFEEFSAFNFGRSRWQVLRVYSRLE